MEKGVCFECNKEFDEDELTPWTLDCEFMLCEDCVDKVETGFKL